MPEPDPHVSRRRVLGLLLVLPAAGVGCTPSDPAVRGGPPQPPPGGSPASTPTPGPTTSPFLAAAPAEQQVADLAAAVLTGPRRADLSSRQRALLTFVRDAHAEHTRVLAGPEPTARVPGDPSPSPPVVPPPAGRSLAASLRLLSDRQAALAAAHRRQAVAASGLAALLWGSLATAAAGYAGAVRADRPPGTRTVEARTPAPVLSDVAAVQQLVAALRAAVYGYQTALGRIPAASGAHDRAEAGLADRRTLLDRLVDRLVDRRAEVPPGEVAYELPVTPRDAATAADLLGRVEVALQPFAGLWLAAAARPADRREALEALTDAAAAARSWGAPVQLWPGWPD